ncbi:MAG: Trm112 family protein [Planctomycetes bacterium]|nr:Trm112 family protein [Planctomycetota bacterium]
MIDRELLDILACPLGKSPLIPDGDDHLLCTSCGLRYRIEEDIPIMLLDEAELPKGVNSIEELKCGESSGGR